MATFILYYGYDYSYVITKMKTFFFTLVNVGILLLFKYKFKEKYISVYISVLCLTELYNQLDYNNCKAILLNMLHSL